MPTIANLYKSLKVKQDFKTDWSETSKDDWKTDFQTTPLAVIPVAAFVANVTTGAHALSVQFTDNSTNTPTFWSWNFGDGGTSTLQNPLHSYAAAGTYTVTLIASNTAGANTGTRAAYIVVT